jgi:AcrR family transcriptional regulator
MANTLRNALMTRADEPETTDDGQAVAGAPLTARGLRTRQQLLAAARRVFERDGFLAARVTDIAQEAGFAHGSFYTYFSSKEDVFRELFLDVQASILQRPELAEGDRDPWHAIEVANRRYLEVYRDNAALLILWEQVAAFDNDFNQLLREWGNERFVARIERALRRWQAQGVADPAIEPTYAAHALTHMATRFAYLMFGLGEPFEFETAVEQLTRLWANALGVKERAVSRRASSAGGAKR